MDNLTGIIPLLKNEQEPLTRELRGISSALAAFGKGYGKGTGTGICPHLLGRGRLHKKLGGPSFGKRRRLFHLRGKRILSATARKRSAAAQRARWARVKATKKTA